MNPFTTIKQQRFLIQSLRKEYPNSKNKKRDWERIKTLENCVNEFDLMLRYSYYTDTIEKLLYVVIKEYFTKAILQNVDGIPIFQLVEHIKSILNSTNKIEQKEVVFLLRDFEINSAINELNKINTIEENSENFNKAFFNLTTNDEWQKMLNKLMNNFKTDIKWSKK